MIKITLEQDATVNFPNLGTTITMSELGLSVVANSLQVHLELE